MHERDSGKWLSWLVLALTVEVLAVSAAHADKDRETPQDTAVLQLRVPAEARVHIDDQDQGKQHRFEYRPLRPGQHQVREVRVRFPDGGEEKRTLLLRGGWHVTLPLAASPASRPVPVVQTGHTGAVTSVAFSQDGKVVLTGANDSTAILWQAATGRTLAVLRGHTGLVTAVALSPDGKEAVTGSTDRTVILWDTTTARPRHVLRGHQGVLHAVAFSPDGKQALSCGGDSAAVLWDAATGKQVQTFRHSDEVVSVAFSPDGRQVLTGSSDGSAILWATQTGRKLYSYVLGENKAEGLDKYIRSAMVTAVAFSPDGTQVVAASQDGSTVVWETATEKRLHTFRGHTASVRAVAFRPGGKQVVTGSADGTAVLWDITSGQKVRTYRQPDRPLRSEVTSVACSPDGEAVLIGMGEAAILYETDTGKERHAFRASARRFLDAVFSVDGKWMLAGGDRAILRELATGRQWPAPAERATAVGPGGKLVLTSSGATAGVWDAWAGKQLCALRGHREYVRTGTFSPDGSRVLTGADDRTAILWETSTGKSLATLRGHTGSIYDLAFSPDGKRVLTGSADHTAILWDATSGRPLHALVGHRSAVESVAFSGDGKRVLTGSWDGLVVVREADTGKPIRVLRGDSGNVFAAAFSPDGKWVVAGTAGSVVILWDVDSGARLRVLRGHTGFVSRVAFAPDGRHLWTASTDYTVRCWDLATGEELVRLFALGNDWLAVTPEGLFDGSEGGRQKVAYRVGGGLDVVPVDRFFQDFYRPGLLASLARGERPLPEADFARHRPPRVRILSPRPGGAVQTRQITLDVEATDEGGGIQGLWLWHNGARVLGGEQPESRANKLRRRFTVSLVQGTNRLEVKAASGDGSWESEPATLLLRYEKPLERPRLYLLAVGINRYADDNLSLRFARSDAEAMADLFRRRGKALYQVPEPIVLLDDHATRPKIRQALRDVSQAARPQDTLVVFLAGHGSMIGQRYYFIPHELRHSDGKSLEEDIRQQGLPADVLGDSLAAVPALKRILILDTCASGGALGLTWTSRNPFAFRGVIEKLGHSQGVFTLAAAAASAQTQEVKELGHGVLTYALLAGLGAVQEGPLKDQSIRPDSPERVASVLEWFSFASGQVPRLTRRYFGREQDVLMSSQGQSFPVLPVEDP